MVHTAIYLKLDVHRVQIIHEAFGAETQEEDARSEERFGEADELLREFELWETAQEWVKQAKLSDQEKQVLDLDLRFHRDTRCIARQLGRAEGHVRVVRKNYRNKLGKPAKLQDFRACANRGPRVHLHGGHGMLDHPGRY